MHGMAVEANGGRRMMGATEAGNFKGSEWV